MKYTQPQISALQTNAGVKNQLAQARVAKTNYFNRPSSIPIAIWNKIPQVIAARNLLARDAVNTNVLFALKNAFFATPTAKRDDAIDKIDQCIALGVSAGDLKSPFAFAYAQYDAAIAAGAPPIAVYSAQSAAFSRQMAIDSADSGFTKFLNVAVPLAIGGVAAFALAPAIAGAAGASGGATASTAGAVSGAGSTVANVAASPGVISSMTGAGISDAVVAQSIAGAAASVSTTTAAAAAAEMAGASWGTLVTGNIASIGSTAMQIAQNLPTPPKTPTPTAPATPTPAASSPLPSMSPASMTQQITDAALKVGGGLATATLTPMVLGAPKKVQYPGNNSGAQQNGMTGILLALAGVGAAIFLL